MEAPGPGASAAAPCDRCWHRLGARALRDVRGASPEAACASFVSLDFALRTRNGALLLVHAPAAVLAKMLRLVYVCARRAAIPAQPGPPRCLEAVAAVARVDEALADDASPCGAWRTGVMRGLLGPSRGCVRGMWKLNIPVRALGLMAARRATVGPSALVAALARAATVRARPVPARARVDASMFVFLGGTLLRVPEPGPVDAAAVATLLRASAAAVSCGVCSSRKPLAQRMPFEPAAWMDLACGVAKLLGSVEFQVRVSVCVGCGGGRGGGGVRGRCYPTSRSQFSLVELTEGTGSNHVSEQEPPPAWVATSVQTV